MVEEVVAAVVATVPVVAAEESAVEDALVEVVCAEVLVVLEVEGVEDASVEAVEEVEVLHSSLLLLAPLH
ncbi:hypothetical protein AAVH_27024 [Aphelenchoides avenae]|nr:hypothetical protein AAVH_27024 [Aphelenchus avenae]